MIRALDRLTACYADQLELDAFVVLRKSLMITRRRIRLTSIRPSMLAHFQYKNGEHYDNPTNVRLYSDGEWDSLIRWLCFSGKRIRTTKS